MVGVEEPIISKPNNKINYTRSIWFQDIIDFLYKHNITIFTKDFFNITSQRKNDRYIMKEMVQLNLPKKSLIKINSCRMYLQVFHLSDMIEPDGKRFRIKYIIGKKILQPKSSYMWQNQSNPSPSAWKRWKKII